jgi:LysM repeat protein
MRRRSPILFIVLNVLVTLVVAFVVLSLTNSRNQQEAPIQVITVEVKITNTVDTAATIPVRIITTTPLPGSQPSIGVLPTGLLETPGTPLAALSTFDATALGADSALQGTATALPQNCILHTIQSGDTPFGIAQQYGADFTAIMRVNGLTDETASLLQIGQVLIVPLEGCPLQAKDTPTPTPRGGPRSTPEATAEATIEATSEATPEPTVIPTMTLPPTAANAQVEIVEVVGIGDVTAEGVVIRNVGNTIDVKNWTLTDSNGNTYQFAERRLFSNASITVFSRVGSDTAIALFRNSGAGLFKPGDVVTLRNARGEVQSTYRIPQPVNLP